MAKLADPKLPPHSIEAEQGVLGCVLLDPLPCLDRLRQEHVMPECFYDLRHRTIYESITKLHAAEKAVDLIILQQRLRDSQKIEMVGGLAYLSSLPDNVPSAANLEYYLALLKEKFRDRMVLDTCREVAELVLNSNGERTNIAIKAALAAFDSLAANGNNNSIVSASDLEASDMKRPIEPVIGLIHSCCKTVIGSGSKAYKTWLVLDLGISVATGSQWLGLDTTKGKVLFVNFEIPAYFFRKRLRMVCEAKGVSLDNLSDFHVLTTRGVKRKVSFRSFLRDVVSQIRGQTYSVIILDPSYMMMEGEENSPKDVLDMLNELEGISVETGAAVVYTAHFAKGNQAAKAALDRISGSGVHARNPDTIITITELKEPGTYVMDAILRNHAPMDAIGLSWEFPLFKREDGLDLTDIKRPDKKPDPVTPEQVAEMVKRPMKKAELVKLIRDATGCAKTAAYKHIFRAELQNKIKCNENGDYVRL